MDKYYLMAESDFYMITKDEDFLKYLAHLYKTMDDAGIFDSSNYPKELFDVEDKSSSTSNATE